MSKSTNVTAVVEIVLDNLKGRGMDNWWDQIDEDIQEEIMDELYTEVRTALWERSDEYGRLNLHE